MVEYAAKAEVGGMFHNGKTAVPLRITLNELGLTNQQPQPKKITLMLRVSSLL